MPLFFSLYMALNLYGINVSPDMVPNGAPCDQNRVKIFHNVIGDGITHDMNIFLFFFNSARLISLKPSGWLSKPTMTPSSNVCLCH